MKVHLKRGARDYPADVEVMNIPRTVTSSVLLWNYEGAILDFNLAPAWHRADWFYLLIVVAALFVVWALYRLRVRQLALSIGVRFDERLAERRRLARELHDTILQTVQGSKLIADDALEQPADPERMHRALENISDWLGQATREGRAALNLLRTSALETNDLAAALRRATETCRLRGATAATFSVVGDSRDIHPIAREEVYLIGYEAIRNACAHSAASSVEVELKYAHDLAVRVSDDGIGIDPAVADEGKPGHYGLQGMRERAARIGGTLTLASSPTSGTEIRVVVPGSIVFRRETPPRFNRLKAIFKR